MDCIAEISGLCVRVGPSSFFWGVLAIFYLYLAEKSRTARTRANKETEEKQNTGKVSTGKGVPLQLGDVEIKDLGLYLLEVEKINYIGFIVAGIAAILSMVSFS